MGRCRATRRQDHGMTGQPGVMASREVPLRSRRSERTVQPHESHLRSVPPCPWRWKGDTSWVDRSPSRANRREAVASVVFVRSCGGGSAVEDALPVLGERAEPDILGGLAVLLGGVLAAASPGGADAGDPAGGPMDATGEAWGFDEALDEDGVGAVAAGPVAGQVAADECEDVGSEVGDADPPGEWPANGARRRWDHADDAAIGIDNDHGSPHDLGVPVPLLSGHRAENRIAVVAMEPALTGPQLSPCQTLHRAQVAHFDRIASVLTRGGGSKRPPPRTGMIVGVSADQAGLALGIPAIRFPFPAVSVR